MPVQTTTSGSLPRTQALIDANRARTFEDDGFTLRSTPSPPRRSPTSSSASAPPASPSSAMASSARR